jgi:serine/threonine protein kinase
MEGKMKTEKFTKLATVDEGTDGVVYKRKDKETNDIYAFKKLKLEKEQEDIPSTVTCEIALLKELQLPNIVS